MIEKTLAEWCAAEIEATGVTAPHCCCCLGSLLWFLTPDQRRSQPGLTEQKTQPDRRGDPWWFLFLPCALSVSSRANSDVTEVMATEQLEANLLMSAVTTELPLQRLSRRSERRVWCVCFEAHVFYQPASQATSRPHPSSPPEREARGNGPQKCLK